VVRFKDANAAALIAEAFGVEAEVEGAEQA
jgi:hypothetical protein